ncbi:MAG: glycosyltransferase [Ectothiorhodospiraceae bacterium]|nr:glycosyltransferase [Ectothiorhodospiraceae bacterium]
MSSAETETPRIAVLISLSGDGGVERMVLTLAAAFAARGLKTDLVTMKTEGGHADRLPAGVRHVPLGVRHASLAAPAIARYLRRERPMAMLVAKDRAGRAALLGRLLARVPTRIVIRLGNTLSESLAGAPALKRWLRYAPIRRLYPLADAIVAVSEGVAEDVITTSGVPAERVHVVRNPVITAELPARAAEPVHHPWLQRPRDMPTILAMGRLTRQKDFPTLLRAFARLLPQRPARLLILGEGRDRPALEHLAAELGIADQVEFAGFQSNPYAWLARADLFVLSSAWEGSPNALTEALALGIPSVSTDCRSGPRETLQDGRYGPLVPVGDDRALADAMVAVLDRPLPADTLREAVRDYREDASARHYLRILGVTPPPCFGTIG